MQVWRINYLFKASFADKVRGSASKDITGNSSSFTFNPAKVLSQFPTELAPNMTSEVARVHAAQDRGNRIAVSQARRAPSSNDEPSSEDRSQYFIVVSPRMKYFLAAQKATGENEMYDKWKLGVGVGVGVGVPLLLVASAFLGWTVGKKMATRKPEGIELGSK